MTRTDDSCIVTTTGRHLKIMRENEENFFCVPIETEEYETRNIGVQLDWRTCGVFRYSGIMHEQGFYSVVPKDMVAAKVVLSKNFAIEVPPHWLVKY